MDRRAKWIMALAALVAVTWLIIHVSGPTHDGVASAETANEHAMSEAGAPDASSAAPSGENAPSGTAPEVLYDLNRLPEPIKRTLEHIVVAAESGNIAEMLPVLQENELPPMLAASAVSDPIGFWKKASADGEGRDILAAMLNVFSSGFVRKGEGKSAMYIWPYFAEMDLSKLTPGQQVELFRIVPAPQALAMLKSGKYTFYRAGLGGDGVWHYFMQ